MSGLTKTGYGQTVEDRDSLTTELDRPGIQAYAGDS